MENKKTSIAEILNSESKRVSGPNESNQMDRALLLTILDNQALILAALLNKSEEQMSDYNVISFESQLEILETTTTTAHHSERDSDVR
jgi:hypothetical protein